MSTTNEEYIDVLKRFYETNGRAPTKRDLPGISRKIEKAFSGWNYALQAAGVAIVVDKSVPLTKLKASLQNFVSKEGRSPTVYDLYRSKGLYDEKTYMKSLGLNRWSEVLEWAGLPFNRERTNEEMRAEKVLLSSIKTLIEGSGTPSSIVYKSQRGALPALEELEIQFGSRKDVLKLAGVSLNRFSFNKSFFAKEVNRYIEDCGKVPSLGDLVKSLGVSSLTVLSHVNNYNKFIKSIRLTPVNKTPIAVTDTNDRLKQQYIVFSHKYGYPNGAPSTALDSSKEISSSDVYLLRFGTMDQLRLECGFQPLEKRQHKFTKEQITEKLLAAYAKKGKILTSREVNADPALPSLSSLLRYFKVTCLSAVWRDVLNPPNSQISTKD
ncbi:hypothetical protein MKQ70_32000 [Chitinophaga sedimenti]|uniref:homing endonuclease associated repeat-containing protein n=1 Tax=Chitinophaga sedimenti TaxID=2033606 RepID=UPI002003EA51|nr:hypothetical protein [Chitinophaga sedimenti]MCK7559341.1 hypothetical protein [Chitinophaga sedimenti]